ncbi:MAG: ATP-binding cassette domain-containing protein [Bacteroidales bacterium]|nr:ATP-binding cassette domain-containing protein [Bacteroidales bacterium]
MIELKNVNKSFDQVQVLSDITLTFEPGKTNLIIGQSGSGKTVLLKTIVGLHEVDSGQILYDGQDFTRMSFKERKLIRKQIGMVFQGGALFDSNTVEENVIYPLSMFTDMTEEEKRDRANFCLSRVNILNANKKYPAEISGGMRKRVAIARAIALNPTYLFCDEPNSGLDPKTAILIDNLIKEITDEFNMTTIVNTHDMNSVMEIGEKVIFIYEGKKWWEGNRHIIFKDPNKELQEFVFAAKFFVTQQKDNQ